MQAESTTYNYKVVRQFAVMTVVWGIVATLGLVAAGMALGTRTFERESG